MPISLLQVVPMIDKVVRQRIAEGVRLLFERAISAAGFVND
jgi:hypothetical protein